MSLFYSRKGGVMDMHDHPGFRRLGIGDQIKPGDMVEDECGNLKPITEHFHNQDPTVVYSGLLKFYRPHSN